MFPTCQSSHFGCIYSIIAGYLLIRIGLRVRAEKMAVSIIYNRLYIVFRTYIPPQLHQWHPSTRIHLQTPAWNENETFLRSTQQNSMLISCFVCSRHERCSKLAYLQRHQSSKDARNHINVPGNGNAFLTSLNLRLSPVAEFDGRLWMWCSVLGWRKQQKTRKFIISGECDVRTLYYTLKALLRENIHAQVIAPDDNLTYLNTLGCSGSSPSLGMKYLRYDALSTIAREVVV